MTTGDIELPAWLPDEAVAWVTENCAFLDEVYAWFDRGGAWPPPGALQRQLVASGRRVRVVSIAEAMPTWLGTRTHSPDEVRLSLFGLGCVSAARPLLERYAAILALAQERYARADEPARLSRVDVADHLELELDAAALDRLSTVLLADHPFLGSGNANLDSWDYEIDDRIIDLDDVRGPDELLARLAEQRQLGSSYRSASATPGLFLSADAPAPAAPAEDGLAPLRRSVGNGVPVEALETYARWWQLETFLREVVYVELRARWGESWLDHLTGTAPGRAARDTVNAYMASADAGDLLAYADVSDLFRLIEDQWLLFSDVLPPIERWPGITHTLRDVRNRNAHCRRPHRDDPGRIQQTLRDLDAGARTFYSSYLHAFSPPETSQDPLALAWIEGAHPTARRLLRHADEGYEVRFELRYSVRPWAQRPEPDTIAGTPGVLWHAEWYTSSREVPVVPLWERLSERDDDDRLVHLLHDGSTIVVTFPAVDAPNAVADTIGRIFDDILTISRPRPSMMDANDDELDRWKIGSERLPGRVQIAPTPLSLLDYELPFSLFGAESLPANKR